MAPLFAHYGVKLWLPEAGGPVGNGEDHEQLMLALGLQSKREVTRTRIRVRTAMATQTREQGRYLGGRPPYGYRLADAGPHPNKAHAAWGRWAHRLEPDPSTAPVVAWMFAQRLSRAQRRADHPRPERCRDPLPVGRRSGAEPAPDGCRVDAADGGGDPFHADHEAAGRAARRAVRRVGLEMLSYPIWMWHWAKPGDRRVPWPQACQVALTADVAAKKKAATGAFASQLTGREGAAGPVLPPGIVAHFTRPLEVLLR